MEFFSEQLQMRLFASIFAVRELIHRRFLRKPVPGPSSLPLRVLERRGGRCGPGMLQHQPGLARPWAQAGQDAGEQAEDIQLQHGEDIRGGLQATIREEAHHRGHSNKRH